MPGIFISYRREDSAGHAGRLFDRLAEHFGRERVFMDVVGIEAGLDFVDAIDKALSSTEVMVAVIGRNWLTGKDSAGQPRLSDPKDFIRLETGTALRRGIRVVPVLVQGAPMPAASDLPEDLVLLARRQAVELSDSRWDSDVSRFVKMLEGMASGGKKKLLLWSAIAVAVLAIGGGLAWYFQPTTVPDLVGKSREEARAALRTARLSPGKEALRAGSGRSPGMVIDQRPAAGERAARGTPVDIAIATETAVIRGNAVLSTSQLDFGTQTLAVMGAPQSVIITNTGAGPLKIATTDLEGDARSDYTITYNTCLGASLEARSKCAVRVNFIPASPGSRQARLVMRDESSGRLGDVALVGTGNALASAAKTARILHFQYANRQLCYGVDNAVTARIEPGLGDIRPLQKECVAYQPDATKTFTLVAVGEDGKEVKRQLTVKLNGSDLVLKSKPKSPRCTEILLRVQLGAPLTSADQALLQKECK